MLNGNSKQHGLYCNCGFHIKQNHVFYERYLPTKIVNGIVEYDNGTQDSLGNDVRTGTHHLKVCECGFKMREEHWFKSGGIVCMYCGYGA